jgi:dTDP-4-dehydrorhamnose reductase
MAHCLVIGADSALGGPLLRRLDAAGHSVLGTTRRSAPVLKELLHLDLTSAPDSWPRFQDVGIAWLMAGRTVQADCKADPEGAHLVNVERLLQLAGKLAQTGTRLVFPSTSLVFDGQSPTPGPKSPLSPQGAYASQKAEVEKALLQRHGQCAAILRLGKVLTPNLPLLDHWRKALLADQPIQPFADLFIAPLDLETATEAQLRLGTSKATGIFQFCAQDQISYADLALRLAQHIGKDAGLVQPVSQREKMKDAPLPAPFATLDVQGTEQALGMKAPAAMDIADNVIRSFLKTD